MILKLCCVDDDRDVSDMLEAAGEAEGICTVSFTSGAEALNFLAENWVDAVLLDLAMPVLDGLSVAEEIRRNEANHPQQRRVKIGFLTGWELNDTIERVAERVQAEAIFKKPCDPLETIAAVKGWFEAV